jgi:hypothetical protein
MPYEVNGGRVCDPAEYYEEKGKENAAKIGTINIMLHVNTNMSSACMTIVTLTEAKTAAIQELLGSSLYSHGIATGSGSDIVIANADSDHVLKYAGKHGKLGELIGITVKNAVKKALALHMDLTPQSQHSIEKRTFRYGLCAEKYWERYKAQGGTMSFERLGIPVVSPINSFYLDKKKWEETIQGVMEKKAFSDFRWTVVEDIVESGGGLYKMPSDTVYDGYYCALPSLLQSSMEETWGPPPGEGMVIGRDIIVSGLRFGNVAVMVQPKRGCYGAKCTGEVCKILHDPACPPPHQYLATYRYIEDIFRADVLIDVGTFGSLEYLPGKTNGLSQNCWPHIVLGRLPSVYIYNAGVTNNALLAKRRIQSVIVDHLPPPCSGADEDAGLLRVRIAEYFHAAELKNEQDEKIKDEIRALIEKIPAAKRVMNNSAEFATGLREIVDAIAKIEEAQNVSRDRIFGTIPAQAAPY